MPPPRPSTTRSAGGAAASAVTAPAPVAVPPPAVPPPAGGAARRAAAALLLVAVVFTGGFLVGRRSAGPGAAHPSVADAAAADIAGHALSGPSRSALSAAAVRGMLAALDDRWADYYTPSAFSRFESALSGRYAGVGLWLRRDGAGRLVVLSAAPGSPAAKAGLVAGSVLVAVDGRSLAHRSVADATVALQGRVGSAVSVTWLRGGQLVTRRLVRVALPPGGDTARSLAAGVLELRVTAFTSGTGAWVRQQLAHAGRLTGVVLDLRDNPGGLLSEAVRTASDFLNGGVVATYVTHGSARQVLRASRGGDTATPLVVLVDGGTASAAEVVAASLQDRGRAVIVGSPTFGKASVQQPFELPDGSAFEVTVGHYLTADGQAIDGVGVKPDVDVPAGSAPAVAEQRALQVLSGMHAGRTAG